METRQQHQQDPEGGFILMLFIMLLIAALLGVSMASCTTEAEKARLEKERYLNSSIDADIIRNSKDWLVYEDGLAVRVNHVNPKDSTFMPGYTYVLNLKDNRYYPFKVSETGELPRLMVEECGMFTQVNDSIVHLVNKHNLEGWYKLKEDFYYPLK